MTARLFQSGAAWRSAISTLTAVALFGSVLFGLAGCSGGQTPGDPAIPTGGDGDGDGSGNADSSSGSGSSSSGPSAPDFSLPTLKGGEITLSDFHGKKVVLIDFWSTTCDPCLQEMPELVKIYNEKKAAGFEVLAISVDGPDTASGIPAKVKSTGMNFPILLDEETEVMDRYNPKGELPFTIVVDRSGTIVLKRASYQPGDTKSWQMLVDAVDGALAR
jgi:peroxiredoxin